MKYAIWFSTTDGRCGNWAFGCNFTNCKLHFEKENEIAITTDINTAYQMREFAAKTFINYKWEVKEWDGKH